VEHEDLYTSQKSPAARRRRRGVAGGLGLGANERLETVTGLGVLKTVMIVVLNRVVTPEVI
jgi:hypothetical protein